MNYDILHNWLLLRALFIFGTAAVFLVFAGIVTWYNAWRDSNRGTDARTGRSSISKQGAGNSTASIA
jgi:hypothetical protein